MPGLKNHSETKTTSQKASTSAELDDQTDQLRVAKGVWSSVKILRQPNLPFRVEHYDWTRRSLCIYSKHPKLLGDRKYARSPAKPCTTTIFLDLPAEVRNTIYRNLLHFPYVELAAKSSIPSNGLARQYHMRFYKHQIKPALKLLRTCKQVNSEASSIFYGENEFRFTAVYGPQILYAFCRTIGKFNAAHLTTVTLHIPFSGKGDDHGPNASMTARRNFDDVTMDKMGLHENCIPSNRRYKKTHENGKFHVAHLLSRTSEDGFAGLQKLRLVMPHDYILGRFDPNRRNDDNGSMLYDEISVEKCRELKVQLIFLEDERDHAHGWDMELDNAALKRNQGLVKYARDEGWEILTAIYDTKGRYEYPVEAPDDGEKESQGLEDEKEAYHGDASDF